LVIILTILTIAYRIMLVGYGEMQLVDLVHAIIATIAVAGFFASLWVLTKGKGMGLGDAKLMIPLGLILGWPNVLLSVFLAFITGAIFGVGLIVTGKRKLKQAIPFGPFLIMGGLIALIWGDKIVAWYLSFLR